MTSGNLNTKTTLLVAAVLVPAVALLAWRIAPHPGHEAAPTPQPGSGTRQNLMIISLSNIGNQHMSLYGYDRKTTPMLDEWARDAWVFENAFTQGSWTLPVGASLFTGLYPYTHKMVGRTADNMLDASIPTLAEVLGQNGYRSAAFTGGVDYFHEFGHMRGFDVTDDNPNFTEFDVVLAQSKAWLSKDSDRPYFLFIHGYDTHCPFAPPEGFKGVFNSTEGKHPVVDSNRCVRGFLESTDSTYHAWYSGGCAGVRDTVKCPVDPVELTQDDVDYLTDRYDEEVLSTDSRVLSFIRSLDASLTDNTVFVVISEHGEMFGKHGRFGRAGTRRGTLYDDVLNVPLIIRTPDSHGKRVKGLAQLIDVMPTALDLLGIPVQARMQGRSLLPLVESDTIVNEYVYSGLPYNQALADQVPDFYDVRTIGESIRSTDWKLIREVRLPEKNRNRRPEESETLELYDLRTDPGELTDVLGANPVVALDMTARLADWSAAANAFGAGRSGTQNIPPNLEQEAREHGYW